MINYDGTLTDELKFYMTMVITFCIATAGLFQFYIIPAEEIRTEIIECMGDDQSRLSFNLCATSTRQKRTIRSRRGQ
jgi:hypothetical protein